MNDRQREVVRRVGTRALTNPTVRAIGGGVLVGGTLFVGAKVIGVAAGVLAIVGGVVGIFAVPLALAGGGWYIYRNWKINQDK